MRPLLHRSYIFLTVLLILMVSCREDKPVTANDALATVGNKSLTRSQLLSEMPSGLSPADSSMFARAYVRSWIQRTIISDIASRDIDMKQIDRMVDDYRNELIMLEYTRQMFDAKGRRRIPEDTLRAYYDTHRDEFITQRPMVKGIYIKVAADAPNLKELRRLYRSKKQSDIDNLEKSQLSGAVHYDYFRDRWIDWEQIELRIPCDFGASGNQFLRTQRNLDFENDGFVYLLDINDILPAGSVMPYETALPLITDRFSYHDRRSYEASLRKSLLDHAVEEGTVTVSPEISDILAQ